MPDSQNDNSAIISELFKSLQSATALMQNLLSEIKDHAVSLAMVKVKLESLTENVETLSHVVRDGNGKGSMMTRLVLAEKELEDIEEEFHDMRSEMSTSMRDIKRSISEKNNIIKKTEEEEAKFKREKTMTHLKIFGALGAGIIALALQIFQIFWK
jgi:hypothetical protein